MFDKENTRYHTIGMLLFFFFELLQKCVSLLVHKFHKYCLKVY